MTIHMKSTCKRRYRRMKDEKKNENMVLENMTFEIMIL